MKRNNKTKNEVLKRRFKIKKNIEPEEINPFSDFKSKYSHLCAWRYLDSDEFAVYEACFPDTARNFYLKSGADKYNHDALDLDIEKHTIDEHKHIDEQYQSHCSVIEDLHIGVEVEKTSVEAKTEQVNNILESLHTELLELKALYSSHNRKAG